MCAQKDFWAWLAWPHHSGAARFAMILASSVTVLKQFKAWSAKKLLGT